MPKQFFFDTLDDFLDWHAATKINRHVITHMGYHGQQTTPWAVNSVGAGIDIPWARKENPDGLTAYDHDYSDYFSDQWTSADELVRLDWSGCDRG